MNLNSTSWIILFFALQSFAADELTKFSAKNLENKAEIEGFGYKTANLILLDKILKDQNLAHRIAPISVAVPNFIGISSQEVKNLLEHASIDVNQEWLHIIEKHTNDLNLEKILEEKNLPLSFIAASELLSAQIEVAFDFLANHVDLTQMPKLSHFLDEAHTHNWRVMARSTGKEDTDKLANAGGNFSEANIDPSLSSVLRGIGRVIASYFKEKSLSQRVIAGDHTILEIPLTPVLIQRMVGEELDGAKQADKIPTGCVVYSEEPSGRVSTISTLQCSYGHNEGVVQSLVPLDTFYIDEHEEIKTIIKNKFERIIPKSGTFALEKIENPKNIIETPSLRKESAIAIHKVTKAIASFYEKAMDIELVYMPSTKTIYVVQARPIVYKKNNKAPSYFTNITQFKSESSTKIMTIIPGDAAVEKITDKSEIIVADTLDKARILYTSGSHILRTQVKAVVVSKNVDATSHAAAVFRGDGKIVAQTTEVGSIEKILKRTPLDLYLDPQRGLLLDLSQGEFAGKSLDELFQKRELQQGWLNYPIPLLLSVGAHHEKYCLKSQEPLAKENECQIDILRHSVAEFSNKLDTLRHQSSCSTQTFDCLGAKMTASLVLDKMENLNMHAHKLVEDLRDNSDSKALKHLFTTRFLETLVYQPNNKNYVDAFSIESIEDEVHAIDQFIKKLQILVDNKMISLKIMEDSDFFVLAKAGEHSALTSETANEFIIFCDKLLSNKDNNQRQEFLKMMHSYIELDIFPLWLNSFFITDLKFIKSEGKEGYEFTFLKKQLDDYQKLSSAAQEILFQKRAFNTTDFEKWEDPKKFISSRGELKKSIEFFTQERILNPKSKIEELMILQTLTHFIELFDLSIKALKSSQKYGDLNRIENLRIKVENFHKLIKDFQALLEPLVEALPSWKLLRQPGQFVSDQSQWLYNLRIRQSVGDKGLKIDQKQFYPSAEFNVKNAAINARQCNDKSCYVHTLEDKFTLIHQSLLAVLSLKISNNLWDRLILPPTFRKLYEDISNQASAYLTGVQMADSRLSVNLNIPYRQHSLRIMLSYNKTNDTTDLEAIFSGDTEYNRWEWVSAYFSLVANVFGFRYEVHKMDSNGLNCQLWNIDPAEPQEIVSLLKTAATITYARAIGGSGYVDFPFSHLFAVNPSALRKWMDDSLKNNDYAVVGLANALEKFLAKKP